MWENNMLWDFQELDLMSGLKKKKMLHNAQIDKAAVWDYF